MRNINNIRILLENILWFLCTVLETGGKTSCWWVFLASFTVSANTFDFYRKVQNHCQILTKRAEGSVVLIVFKGYPPSRPTERGSQPGWGPMAHEFKQVESCFLNHNSSIHFCCTDSSLLMTHRGGLSLSIIIWRIGGGGTSFLLPWAQQFSWRPSLHHMCANTVTVAYY
jgi:hypothetical protein